MQFLRRALDEPSAERCGKCSSCLQHPLLSPDIDSDLLHAANLFIKHADLPLNLNKQVASGAFTQYGFKGTCLRVYKDLRANPFSLGRFRVGKAGSPGEKRALQ